MSSETPEDGGENEDSKTSAEGSKDCRSFLLYSLTISFEIRFKSN